MKTIRMLSVLIAIISLLSGCNHTLKVYQPARIKVVPVKADKSTQIQSKATKKPVKKSTKFKKMSVGKTLDTANKHASQKPSKFQNAIIQYDFMDGVLYHIYTSPKKITDIRFEPGETIIDVNGADTTRWKIARTASGSGMQLREHLNLKPIKPKLKTNFIITTDRRTYYLNLTSFVNSYMTAVSWKYPTREYDTQRYFKDVFLNLDKADLNFRYSLKGNAPWIPEHVFDDGAKTYIQFPNTISQFELPPLYLVSKHSSSQLVNYRFLNNCYVVDKIFAEALLKVGQDQVHIYNETLYKKSWWEKQSSRSSKGENHDN